MKTQEEILKRIKEIDNRDTMGFEKSDLINFLSFKNAKQFLVEEAKEKDWEQDKNPKKIMIDYMSFAKEKAEDERGLSAGRSICHFMAWLWLDGNTELAEKIWNYSDYGKPQLKKICEYLNLDYERGDF